MGTVRQPLSGSPRLPRTRGHPGVGSWVCGPCLEVHPSLGSHSFRWDFSVKVLSTRGFAAQQFFTMFHCLRVVCSQLGLLSLAFSHNTGGVFCSHAETAVGSTFRPLDLSAQD